MTHLTLLDGDLDDGPFGGLPLPGRLPPGRHGIPAGIVVEHQRRRLLAAMGEALVAEGYAGVTTTAVSKGAGVSTGTFYKHFGNLWDCLLAAYVTGADLLCERIEAACAAPEDEVEPLRRGIDAALDFLASEPELAYLLCTQPPLEATAIASARRLLIARLAALLRRGRGPDDEGTRPPSLDERMIDATLVFVCSRIAARQADRLRDLGPADSDPQPRSPGRLKTRIDRRPAPRHQGVRRGYAQPVRVLVVTNFVPDSGAPQRGRWVRDQVEELRRQGIEVEVFEFPRGRGNYMPATRRLRKLLRQERFDLVHAHYGLVGWCARLAGARPLVVSFHGTDVRHWLVGAMSRRLAWRVDLVGAVSRALFEPEDGRPGLPVAPGSAVLPCGPDLSRFKPLSRADARGHLGLDLDGRYLLFPANPSRPEKRHDRAAELAAACEAQLLTGGAIDPDEMPLWVNAANAVVVTSDYEGFGLVAVEALACDVPVLSTPVGVAPYALRGVEGTLCAPFDLSIWANAAAPLLASADPRTEGAVRAASLSAARMAERTAVAYRAILAEG